MQDTNLTPQTTPVPASPVEPTPAEQPKKETPQKEENKKERAGKPRKRSFMRPVLNFLWIMLVTFLVTFGVVYFLLVKPAQDNLAKSQAEVATLTQQLNDAQQKVNTATNQQATVLIYKLQAQTLSAELALAQNDALGASQTLTLASKTLEQLSPYLSQGVAKDLADSLVSIRANLTLNSTSAGADLHKLTDHLDLIIQAMQ
jgi:outer membrane biosynthesis protein TonB